MSYRVEFLVQARLTVHICNVRKTDESYARRLSRDGR